MNLLQIQNRVLARLNLATDEARDRITGFINERNRALQTSPNLGRVRKITIQVQTISGVSTLVPSGIIKPLTVVFPALNRVLGERTLDQIRTYDPVGQWIGAPEIYAVDEFNATSCQLYFEPQPNAVYDLTIDGIALGSDLIDPTDVPNFPEDFHDALVFGAVADEYSHQDDQKAMTLFEQKFQRRVSELRYFIQKSIYLHREQGGANWWASAGWWWTYGAPWVI